MKSIVKSKSPVAFELWKKTNEAVPQNLQYANLDAATKQSIKESLLQEQGYICAYTLRRINTAQDCHIEHVEAQNYAIEAALDYNNMAGCVPTNGGDLSLGYGAPVKSGAFVLHNQNFVFPHKPFIEQRFTYTSSGDIAGIAGDEAASKTIQVLKLNHSGLKELRDRAIQTHGISLRPKKSRYPVKQLSAASARDFAKKVLEPNANGKLEPFCTCLSHIALKFAQQEEERSARLRGKSTTNN